jgi:hypothetical protein
MATIIRAVPDALLLIEFPPQPVTIAISKRLDAMSMARRFILSLPIKLISAN